MHCDSLRVDVQPAPEKYSVGENRSKKFFLDFCSGQTGLRFHTKRL